MSNEKVRELVKILFKTRDSQPLILTDGQLQIFEAIVTSDIPSGTGCVCRISSTDSS
jgi:hypothetical protein